MTLTQLSTLLTIVETGSFTATADRLGYAQSTITTQIKQLETELNCLLFERLGKGLILTQDGTHLAEYSRKMLQLEREIRFHLPSTKEPCGTLYVGVSESLCYQKLPAVLSTFREQCPQVEIQLKFITHDTFPSLLKKGELDLVYTLNPSIDLPELKKLYQREERLGFYVSPDHPLADREQVTEKDLDHMPLLLTDENCNFRKMLLDALREKNIAPKVVLGTSHKEILKQFAIDRFGIAFIPDITAEKEVKSGALKRLSWCGKDFPVYAQVFIHKDKALNTTLDRLIRIILSS